MGRVTKVYDGDTVLVRLSSGKKIVCRLFGIDSPETAKPNKGKPGQPFGKEATRFLREISLNENVRVELTGDKSYRREICILWKDGTEINLEMIKSGYAQAYRKFLYGRYARDYISAEQTARKNKIGLWTQDKPTSPWKFKWLNWKKRR